MAQNQKLGKKTSDTISLPPLPSGNGLGPLSVIVSLNPVIGNMYNDLS